MVTGFADFFNKSISVMVRETFGIDELPTTRAELKSAFRRESKKLHTDTSGGDTADAFIKMKADYDLLLKSSGVFIDEDSIVDSTVEGIPLSDLGLGLGPTVNGADCPTCSHRGWGILNLSVWPIRCAKSVIGMEKRPKFIVVGLAAGRGNLLRLNLNAW